MEAVEVRHVLDFDAKYLREIAVNATLTKRNKMLKRFLRPLHDLSNEGKGYLEIPLVTSGHSYEPKLEDIDVWLDDKENLSFIVSELSERGFNVKEYQVKDKKTLFIGWANAE